MSQNYTTTATANNNTNNNNIDVELQQRLFQAEERCHEYEFMLDSKNQEVAFAEQSLHEIQEELRKRTTARSPQHDLIPSPSKDDGGAGTRYDYICVIYVLYMIHPFMAHIHDL